MAKSPSNKSVTTTRLRSLELRSGTLADIHKLAYQTAQAELLQHSLGVGSDDPVIEDHLDQVRNADFLPRLVAGGGFRSGSKEDLKFWQSFRKDLSAMQKRIDAAIALIQAASQKAASV